MAFWLFNKSDPDPKPVYDIQAIKTFKIEHQEHPVHSDEVFDK